MMGLMHFSDKDVSEALRVCRQDVASLKEFEQLDDDDFWMKSDADHLLPDSDPVPEDQVKMPAQCLERNPIEDGFQPTLDQEVLKRIKAMHIGLTVKPIQLEPIKVKIESRMVSYKAIFRGVKKNLVSYEKMEKLVQLKKKSAVRKTNLSGFSLEPFTPFNYMEVNKAKRAISVNGCEAGYIKLDGPKTETIAYGGSNIKMFERCAELIREYQSSLPEIDVILPTPEELMLCQILDTRVDLKIMEGRVKLDRVTRTFNGTVDVSLNEFVIQIEAVVTEVLLRLGDQPQLKSIKSDSKRAILLALIKEYQIVDPELCSRLRVMQDTYVKNEKKYLKNTIEEIPVPVIVEEIEKNIKEMNQFSDDAKSKNIYVENFIFGKLETDTVEKAVGDCMNAILESKKYDRTPVGTIYCSGEESEILFRALMHYDDKTRQKWIRKETVMTTYLEPKAFTGSQYIGAFFGMDANAFIREPRKIQQLCGSLKNNYTSFKLLFHVTGLAELAKYADVLKKVSSRWKIYHDEDLNYDSLWLLLDSTNDKRIDFSSKLRKLYGDMLKSIYVRNSRYVMGLYDKVIVSPEHIVGYYYALNSATYKPRKEVVSKKEVYFIDDPFSSKLVDDKDGVEMKTVIRRKLGKKKLADD